MTVALTATTQWGIRMRPRRCRKLEIRPITTRFPEFERRTWEW